MLTFPQTQVFEAIGYDDGGPANAGSFHIAYFNNRIDAAKAAKGKGSWGGDGSVRETKVSLTIYDSYDEYLESCANSKLKEILSKLSDDEYKILQKHFGKR